MAFWAPRRGFQASCSTSAQDGREQLLARRPVLQLVVGMGVMRISALVVGRAELHKIG